MPNDLINKLTYLSETKNQIKTALQGAGSSVNNATPFRDYVAEIDALGGTPSVTVPTPTIDTYIRPADWIALPAVTEGEQKVVALYAVYDNESNFVAIKCTGDYTVDWGDGAATENISSGVQAEHNYDYADVSNLSTRGYKQAVVTVTPNGSNLTSIELGNKHSTITSSDSYSTALLDIRMAGSSFATIKLGGTYVKSKMLEQFEFIGTNAIASTSDMFNYCLSLKKIVQFG